ncbi:MAG TPA: hypothetical protein VK465_05670, partial [Fibrobacteria bacterium]|nr:hypothetical protein [Fibrobacteria bacterium]
MNPSIRILGLVSTLASVTFSQADLQVSPASLFFNFNPTDAPADQTVVVTNTGNQPVTASVLTFQTAQPPAAARLSATATAGPAPDLRRIYSAQAYSGSFATDRVIIVFKEGRGQLAYRNSAVTAGATNDIQELATARDPGSGQRVNQGRRMAVAHLQAESRAAVLAAIEALRQDPNVAYVQPDYVLQSSEIPNDPEFARQYHLENRGQDGGTPGADIKATQGWNKQKSA